MKTLSPTSGQEAAELLRELLLSLLDAGVGQAPLPLHVELEFGALAAHEHGRLAKSPRVSDLEKDVGIGVREVGDDDPRGLDLLLEAVEHVAGERLLVDPLAQEAGCPYRRGDAVVEQIVEIV